MQKQTTRSQTVSPPPWGVIADDLTGACDTGVQFSERGFRTVVVLDRQSDSVQGSDVVVASTASRDDSPQLAREKVRQACLWMHSRGIRVIYKKVDSTLRGNVGPEVEAVMETCEFTRAVLTPAFPMMGRVVADGRLEVRSSDSFDPIDIASVLPATAALAVKDAETTEELAQVARQALDSRPLPLLVGSAGLASQVAAILASRVGRLSRLPRPERVGKPILILIGSTHPVTVRQVDQLRRQACFEVVDAVSVDRACCQQAATERRHVLVTLDLGRLPQDFSEKLRDLTNRGSIGALILSGGDTAAVVCSALEAEGIELIAELTPGIPSGRLRGGAADGLTVVTKSGGFGNPDSLRQIAEILSPWRPTSAA